MILPQLPFIPETKITFKGALDLHPDSPFMLEIKINLTLRSTIAKQWDVSNNGEMERNR